MEQCGGSVKLFNLSFIVRDKNEKIHWTKRFTEVCGGILRVLLLLAELFQDKKQGQYTKFIQAYLHCFDNHLMVF